MSSFVTLNKDVLQQVANEFGVEWTTEDPKKNEMIKDLEDEGVTWAMYKDAFPDPTDDEPEDDEPEVQEKTESAAEFKTQPKKVLVKMTRANGTFEVRGYRFTKAHPFLPVSEEDANYIVGNLEGFAIATPGEAEEYYS